NRLQIEGRAADDLEHVGGGGLLLERFTEFAEQSCILDGDDGLCGEIFDQLDLLLGERPHFLPVDTDGADHLVVFQHWYPHQRPRARKIDDGLACFIAVRWPRRRVLVLEGLLSPKDRSQPRPWIRVKHPLTSYKVSIGLGSAVHRTNAEAISVA